MIIRKFLCTKDFKVSRKRCKKGEIYNVVDCSNDSTFMFENGEMTLSIEKMEEFLNERSDVLQEIEEYV